MRRGDEPDVRRLGMVSANEIACVEAGHREPLGATGFERPTLRFSTGHQSGIRRKQGLGSGVTLSLDRVTLTSRRLGLTGRPDRLIRSGGTLVIEEWKSARQVWPWHRAQMGVYFLLAEERYGVRPSHGFIVCGDGGRHRIDNTAELRAWVLEIAGQIRAARDAADRGYAGSRPVPTVRDAGTLRAGCQLAALRDYSGASPFSPSSAISVPQWWQRNSSFS